MQHGCAECIRRAGWCALAWLACVCVRSPAPSLHSLCHAPPPACPLPTGACDNLHFIVVGRQNKLKAAGQNWEQADWDRFCAAGTPTTCPNRKGISNLSHAACAASSPFNWRCLGKVESFPSNPMPTPWGNAAQWP